VNERTRQRGAADAFARARQEAADAETPTEVGRQLLASYDQARRTWPDIELTEQTFIAHVAERAPDASSIDSLPPFLTDLYLACACEHQDAAALRHFDDDVLAEATPILRRLGLDDATADDVRQEVRVRLLVGEQDRPPRVTQFLGTGPLVQWVRAVAGRVALARIRRDKPSVELDEDLVDAALDPGLAAVKERYRGDFKAALHAAGAELPPRDRTVLRALVLDGASIGQIAAAHRVHRATASRWVSRLRRDLYIGTRRHLRNNLGLTDCDLDSLTQLIESQIEMSLSRLLRET
jgi:RNA polymerase sigma-70 factor (ECF subfamily)